MPRRNRHYLQGYTYHIVQRGNNRQPCFFADDDYAMYLNILANALRRYQVALHAYVLMTNHVHFLLTPSDSVGISNVMKVVGSRYAQYINRNYQRTGSLWEGRHKSSAIDSERYLLTCYRYIERNPVVAKMVSHPVEYPWSSYPVNAAGADSEFLSPHDEYLNLGRTRAECCAAYAALFETDINDDDLQSIRKAAHYGQPLGSVGFKNRIAAQSGLGFGYMQRGRPELS